MKKNFKKDFIVELSIIQLINRFFWKSKLGPMSALILPIAFMSIYKMMSIAKSGVNNDLFSNGLASYLSLSMLPLALITLPQIIVDLKNSIVLRKISISRVTSLRFSTILISYFLIAQVTSVLIIICLYATFLNKDAGFYFSRINWGEMVYAILNVLLISLAFGYMLGVLFKKPNMPQLAGFILLLLSLTLSGQFIPLTVIAESSAIKYISLFSPLTYALSLVNTINMIKPEILLEDLTKMIGDNKLTEEQMIQILNYYNEINIGKSIFDLSNDCLIIKFNTEYDEQNLSIINKVSVFETWQKVLNLIMSYVLSGTFIFVGIKKFNWTSR